MEKALISLIAIFCLGLLALVFGSRNRSIKKTKINLKQKMKRGFVSGFSITFVLISLFAIYMVYIKQDYSGTFSSFIIFNMFTSFSVAVLFSLVSIISSGNDGEIDLVKAKGVIGLFFIGLIIVGMIFL